MSLPIKERLESIRTSAYLDHVNWGLIKDQMDKVDSATQSKAKALQILKRKVDYALRPLEKPDGL